MNEKMITESVLSLLKGSADLHLHGTIESSTLNVRGAFEKSLNDVLDMQKEVYSAMSQKGWYPMTEAEQQKIDQAKQKYSQPQAQ